MGWEKWALEKRQRLRTETTSSLHSEWRCPQHTLWLLGSCCALCGQRLGVRGGLQAVPGGSVFDVMGCVFKGAGRKGRHHPYTTLPGLSLLPSKPLSCMRLGLGERWLWMTPHYPMSFPCPQPSPPS